MIAALTLMALAAPNTCNYLIVESSPIKAVVQTRGDSGELKEFRFEFELEIADGKGDDEVFEIRAEGRGKVESLVLYAKRGNEWQGFPARSAEGVRLPVLFCVMRRRPQ